MHTHLLIREGELFLKGKNMLVFKHKLISNIKQKFPGLSLRTTRGRIIMPYVKDHQRIKNVFGIVSYSPARRVEKNISLIKEAALGIMVRVKKPGLFRVETKRSDKTFPLTSMDINRLIGRYIEENSSLRFDLHHPSSVLTIEINQDGAYLFTETISCFGGMPVGVEGKVPVIIDNDAGLLAALLIMKRGCEPILFGFKEQDISLLNIYSPKPLSFQLVASFEEIKNSIIVNGEHLGNYKCGNYKGKSQCILRPLIAYSEKRIQKELEIFRQASC